ncbi:MAG TPA: CBS domain-containing protein [Blastocatellia bacterium]|nr:CBS domain-containing protein [Blastocatellia bacterium]
MKVREIMNQPVITVREETTLEETARLMLGHDIGCVPVVNAQGGLCRIITESDFAAKEKGFPLSTFRAPQVLGQCMGREGVVRIHEAARQLTARDIISATVVTLTEEQLIDDAAKLMLHYDINRLPVVSEGVPVGIVARHDLLKMMVVSWVRETE